MFWEYLNFFLFILFNFLISTFLLFLSYSLNFQEFDYEKNSAYQCGFQPFDSPMKLFEIKYYYQALLFLIFDLEIMFLLPFIMSLHSISLIGFFFGIFFFLILLLGFLYEWKIGALEWE